MNITFGVLFYLKIQNLGTRKGTNLCKGNSERKTYRNLAKAICSYTIYKMARRLNPL
jgi:hypothetical protein